MFFVNRTKSLLIPYYAIILILFIYNNILRYLGIINFNNHEYIKAIFYSNKIYPMNYVGALWFLACLFVTEILYFLLNDHIKSNKIRLALIICFSIIGAKFTMFTSIRLPFWFDIAFTALAFYYCGQKFKDSKLEFKILNNPKFFLLPFFFFNIIFTILNYRYYNTGPLNGRIDMLYMQYNNYFYFYIAALTGILFYLLLSKLLEKHFFCILQSIGKNTLGIMAFHISILQLLVYYNKNIFMVNNTFQALTVSILVMLIVLSLNMTICYIINKFCPVIVGRR